jgi:rod shape-determining protein MreD
MIRVVPYILYVLLIAAWQVIVRDMTAIFGATVNLTGMMVLMVALYKSEVTAAWFGFVTGLVLAAGSPAIPGWHALFLAALGVAGYQVRERLNLEASYSKELYILGGVMLHNVFLVLTESSSGIFHLMWSRALTGAVYTAGIAWLFFMVKEGRITRERVRSVF